ncbi:MAG: D-alanyl-D-alanine carboxypeptidase/D-alanyl-D-alanine-endopeptidase [Acidimicrobiales bacterium]|nr:D-alanyl-D-alanine carboxypeptidase/D-alanyl-D-alanine-endopeptidase [Acidimicrobiales bacterium]
MLGLLVGGLVALGPTPSVAQQVPVAVRGPDPTLTRDLDALMAQAPPDTCLRVSVDGVAAYDHRGSDLQSPASTEKVLTAGAVLDGLGPDHRLRTEVVAAAPPVGGIVEGDVTLVGGGDPVLVTEAYRAYRGIGDDRPHTSLDALADALREAGVTEIRGRLLVDDGRYDAERRVPSWPPRITADDPDPLGALVVDDGWVLDRRDGAVERRRPGDPAVAAGDALRWLLALRGVRVGSDEVGRGSRPAGGVVLAGVDSPPVDALVTEMLLRSDNHIAEQLLKELGVVTEGRGETAAGARAVAAWTARVGAATPGSRVVDGSGLDPTNATSCQGLVAALDAVGPEGTVGQGLPVAGRSGTLAGRFASTAAAGRLRAKTGTLDDVRALAGFVELPEGATATFAFVANGQVGARTLAIEAFLAQLLATWLPPCPEGDPAPIDAPLSAPAVLVPIAPGPWGAAAAPGLVTALVALEGPATAPLDRCARASRPPVALGTG